MDQDGSKEIEYEEFIHAFRLAKAMRPESDEQDTVDAWAALGGNVRARVHGAWGWTSKIHTVDACAVAITMDGASPPRPPPLTEPSTFRCVQIDTTGKILVKVLLGVFNVGSEGGGGGSDEQYK